MLRHPIHLLCMALGICAQLLDVVCFRTPQRHSVIDVGNHETQQTAGESAEEYWQPTYRHRNLNVVSGSVLACICIRWLTGRAWTCGRSIFYLPMTCGRGYELVQQALFLKWRLLIFDANPSRTVRAWNREHRRGVMGTRQLPCSAGNLDGTDAQA